MIKLEEKEASRRSVVSTNQFADFRNLIEYYKNKDRNTGEAEDRKLGNTL